MEKIKWSFFRDGKVVYRVTEISDTADIIGAELKSDYWCHSRDEKYCLEKLTTKALKK